MHISRGEAADDEDAGQQSIVTLYHRWPVSDGDLVFLQGPDVKSNCTPQKCARVRQSRTVDAPVAHVGIAPEMDDVKVIRNLQGLSIEIIEKRWLLVLIVCQ